MGYAFKVFSKFNFRELKVKATGNAIVKAMILIELIKRREKNLYQINEIYSIEKVTYEESTIEGMDKIPNTRRITALEVLLSKDPLDKNHPGYQEFDPKDYDFPVRKPQKKEAKKKEEKAEGKQRKEKAADEKHEQRPQREDLRNLINEEKKREQDERRNQGRGGRGRRPIRYNDDMDHNRPRPPYRGGRPNYNERMPPRRPLNDDNHYHRPRPMDDFYEQRDMRYPGRPPMMNRPPYHPRPYYYNEDPRYTPHMPRGRRDDFDDYPEHEHRPMRGGMRGRVRGSFPVRGRGGNR
jgi:DNA-binding protein